MLPTGRRIFASLIAFACVIGASGLLLTEARPVYSGLTVHEWGTFTSIAGSDGQALVWWPLTGAVDLPSFVEHFRNARFKFNLEGTVRMETPVIYFYSPREEKVSLGVRFAKGVITEWYPHASRIEPVEALDDWTLSRVHEDGSITWDAVTLTPNSTAAEFPTEAPASHYYTARHTTSTPLTVQTPVGEQGEKFLFYRGVSMFQPPVAAAVLSAAKPGSTRSKIRVENRDSEPIPTTILFERRGDKLGFRIGDSFSRQTTLDSLDLNGSLKDLCSELEGILIAQGLYANEAQAMVETWRDSWFEEGSRLLYIVPQDFVNSVLPLTIHPAPLQTVRVFVGRMELVTPATWKAVQRAVATHDDATLAKYGRFVEPILQMMVNAKASPQHAQELRDALNGERASQWYLNPTKKK